MNCLILTSDLLLLRRFPIENLDLYHTPSMNYNPIYMISKCLSMCRDSIEEMNVAVIWVDLNRQLDLSEWKSRNSIAQPCPKTVLYLDV